jgi:hypothetical protein
MPFDVITRTVLEYYTAHAPATEDVWYGPWTTILTTFFPSTQGYIVTPQRRPPDDPESHIPDFIIEVAKLSSTAPLTFRTVLIVKVKNSQHWQSEYGIQALQRQLNRQTDAAFAGTAHTKLYWIGTIGPHWRYGEREDNGQDLRPLIDWHHTTHDQASFNDFRVLADLVSALYVFNFRPNIDADPRTTVQVIRYAHCWNSNWPRHNYWECSTPILQFGHNRHLRVLLRVTRPLPGLH